MYEQTATPAVPVVRSPAYDALGFGALRLIRMHTTEPAYYAPAAHPIIRGLDDAAAILRPYADAATTEVFWVLALDCNRHVIGDSPVEVGVGTLDSVSSGAREIFRVAVVAGAHSVILAHNHPAASSAGQPEPSDADVHATRAMVQVGAILGIPVLDHIIMGPDGHTSLAERGVIEAATEGEHPVSDLVQRGFSEFDAMMYAMVRARGQDPTPALCQISNARAGDKARRGLGSER